MVSHLYPLAAAFFSKVYILWQSSIQVHHDLLLISTLYKAHLVTLGTQVVTMLTLLIFPTKEW